MPEPIATGELRSRILMGGVIYGIFFGLMPPYVLTIVVVATWGMPPLEPPDEQTFRAIYYLRLVLGNVVGLLSGAVLAAFAVDFGLRFAGKATYARAILGGALLGTPVGALNGRFDAAVPVDQLDGPRMGIADDPASRNLRGRNGLRERNRGSRGDRLFHQARLIDWDVNRHRWDGFVDCRQKA